jgi:hypothetical protein
VAESAVGHFNSFHYTLILAFELKKTTGDLGQGTKYVLDTVFPSILSPWWGQR